MHPLFRSRAVLLAYVALWIPLGAMVAVVLKASAHLRWNETAAIVAPLTIAIAVICLLPQYVCRSLPLVTASPARLLTSHLIAAMCASALVLALVPLALRGLANFYPGLPARFPLAVPALAGMIFLFYLLSTALHYVVQAVESSRQAEILSREAELKALKAQVNPHFLFNSLNSISALTSVDPAKAREMCIRLSDFLRNSLRLGERIAIPFGEELALTNTYLDVEQVRFGERLRVERSFEPGCDACDVPPLLVQPLVENAIKHGIASLAAGGRIAMSAHMQQDRLQFTIENEFDPDAPAQRKSGFGLKNVRERLRARYGSAGSLDVQVEQNIYRVRLSLPCGQRAGREVVSQP
jgi:two-component system sensor histidine kinase AlgZ